MKTGMSPIFGSTPAMRWLLGVSAIVSLLVAHCELYAGHPRVDDLAFNRAGLKVQWFTQAGLGSRGELVDWVYVVDENDATTVYELTAGDVRQVFSNDTLTASGKSVGSLEPDMLKKYLEMRQEIVDAEVSYKTGKAIKSTVKSFSKPKSRIVLLTSGAVVRSLDAETGAELWSATVDDPSKKSYGVAATNDWVVAAVGNYIHCLDAKTGKFQWTRHCRYIISGSPAIVGNEVYVPLFDGKVERFRMDDEGRFSGVLVSMGVATTRPKLSGLTVGWGSSKGVFSVGRTGLRKPILSFQLKTQRPIVAAPAHHDYTYYVVSQDGYLYSVDELKGRVNWEVATGGSISQSPFVLDGHVYVLNDRHELHKFDLKRGRVPADWTIQEGLKTFLGASKDNLYFLNKLGRLEVRSRASGAVVASSVIGDVAKTMPHVVSDRMFLVDEMGTIRCVRELASNNPFYHGNAGDLAQPSKPQPKPGSGDTDNVNPFLQEATPKKDDPDNPFAIGG